MKKLFLLAIILITCALTLEVYSLQKQQLRSTIVFAAAPGDYYSKDVKCVSDPGTYWTCNTIICCKAGQGTCTMSQICAADCSTSENCGSATIPN